MLTKNEILLTLKELKPVLHAEFAVKEIGLFGSYCDESNTFDSDIDLLVELDKPIGWKFFSLQLYLEKVFGKKIDLVTKDALKDQLRFQVLKDVSYACATEI
jgi:uncharacterized protein